MNTTLETESVENLRSTLQQVVPLPKAITRLQANDDFGYITFGWYGREFLVNKSKQVFELKERKVFVTGLSMLMQTVLNGAGAPKNYVKRIISELTEVEELITTKHRVELGLNQLDLAKKRIRQLVRTRA